MQKRSEGAMPIGCLGSQKQDMNPLLRPGH